jgi:transcriptional regulator with XRE-family HTH domain
MSLFSDNLRHLRAQKGFSQKKLGEELIISRERLAKYEDGRSEPPLDILKRIAQYFHSVNLLKTDISQLLKMEDNRILLPITVDKKGRDNIEIITHKAKAGYMAGYSDPEYIEGLEHISLPFLSKAKYRAFPIDGDSMPPHREGSFIVGHYIEKLTDMTDGKSYVLLTRNEGIVYKRVYRKNKGTYVLHSDNSFYKPYEIKTQEIIEIWQYACSLATKEFEQDDLSALNIKQMFLEIKKGLSDLK